MSLSLQPSIRAQIIERRTYLRPLNEAGTLFETPEQALQRQMAHQRWLWTRAQGRPLSPAQEAELTELADLIRQRKVTLSGRTRWLGGTETASRRESSQFNCSFKNFKTVHDGVDLLWLLLQGCGVGARPVIGILNGFSRPIEEVEVIRSELTMADWDAGFRASPDNEETFYDGIWTIKVGDSAEAWAKALGKLLAGKFPARKLVLDLRRIRPSGVRLKGYGWISSGDAKIAIAFPAIAKILSQQAGKLLTRINLLDIFNWMAEILTSRRAAELGLLEWQSPEWEEFALAKRDYWTNGNDHRRLSNNTILFDSKPTRRQLKSFIDMMIAGGGSDPGLANGVEALRRAPYFSGFNPCAEILLGDGSFCNLVETVLPYFNGDEEGLHRAHYLVARACYRQTCVNLHDGILQHSWHELNEFLRLTGSGVTGVVDWEFVNEPEAWRDLRKVARRGVDSMAFELGLPLSQLNSTVKPSGTQSKANSLAGFEIKEGMHNALGRYIFNNVDFSSHDPLVPKLEAAGFHVRPNPYDAQNVLVRLPVEYGPAGFTKTTMKIGGRQREVEVNLESATTQLDRYRMVMDNYVDHNASITVSYDKEEAGEIVDWLADNWSHYVGVSFLFRNDPTKTAGDLGHRYLPQEVVDAETYHAYADTLRNIDLLSDTGEQMIDVEEGCVGGVCPVR